MNNYTESGERIDYHIPLPDTLYTAMMMLYGFDTDSVVDGKWSQFKRFLPLFSTDNLAVAMQKLRELGLDTRASETEFDYETGEVIREFRVRDYPTLDRLEEEAVRRKVQLPTGLRSFDAIVTLRSRPL